MNLSLNRIRVVCVDDNGSVRRALAVALSAFNEIEVVGEASNGEDAIELCATAQPDVVVMDVVMPGVGGPAAARLIHKQWPAIKVIGLTNFAALSMVQDMKDAGAVCCLLKNVSAAELAEAIGQAMADGLVTTAAHSRTLL